MYPLSSSALPRANRHLALLASGFAVSALLASGSFAATPPSLMYEGRFNDANGVILEEGGGLGDPGSGVSGQPKDKAYSSKSIIPQPGETGPFALITQEANVEPTDLTEFTVTAWYKPHENVRNDVVLYNAFGSLLIWEEKNKQWVLRVGAKFTDGQNHMYWFASGNKPPMESWMTPNQWTFIAMTWNKTENSVVFYQGSPTLAVSEAKTTARKDAVDVVGETEKAKRTIGGDFVKRDRAFDGEVDDVRFFAKALDASTLEKIRAADLKNAPVSVP